MPANAAKNNDTNHRLIVDSSLMVLDISPQYPTIDGSIRWYLWSELEVSVVGRREGRTTAYKPVASIEQPQATIPLK